LQAIIKLIIYLQTQRQFIQNSTQKVSSNQTHKKKEAK